MKKRSVSEHENMLFWKSMYEIWKSMYEKEKEISDGWKLLYEMTKAELKNEKLRGAAK